jgi:hypothetical protein
MATKVNTKQVKSIADKSEKIGDYCLEKFDETKKLELAKTGISAYRNVLYANSLLIKANKDL